MTDADALDAFEAQRGQLFRLAYRMLGQVSEAEDVVQDAWLRWRGADAGAIDDPAAWLVRTATRLCLDRLRAARVRREAYRGPWLPEPLVQGMDQDPLERAEEVSTAFLLALERLSPLERAVFLLRDVFDDDYAAIARTIGRTETTCRQLAARARAHVQEARPRFAVSDAEATRLATAFMVAAHRNDLTALKDLLAEDAVMVTDGGGKRKAALRPMVGRDDVLALIEGLIWRGSVPLAGTVRLARINGAPGVVLGDGADVVTIAFDAAPDGKVAAIYVLRNPDKLAHVRR